MKKNTVGKLTLSDFKTYYYKTTVIKTWHDRRREYINLWNKTESTEIHPNLYGQLIFGKCAEVIQNEGGIIFLTNGAITVYPYKKKMNLYSYLECII